MIWFLLFFNGVKCLSLEKSEPKPEPVLGPIPIDVGFKSLDSLSGQQQLGSETCVLCKMAVAKIDEFIANPENDGKVMDALEETCDNLPGDYADRCKAIIEMYGPQLIKMVEANLQPDAICGALGLVMVRKRRFHKDVKKQNKLVFVELSLNPSSSILKQINVNSFTTAAVVVTTTDLNQWINVMTDVPMHLE